jgi:hypothetical protein
MKYDGGAGWSTHSGVNEVGWYLGKAAGDKLEKPPGTIGHRIGRGGFEDFEACVEANRQTEPVELEFEGGKLGIWLFDRPYRDNIAGPDGRNPAWRLDRVGDCSPVAAPR